MNTNENLSLRHILNVWWPLAASWLLMAAESPAMSAIVSRLSAPKINLAAYGGVAFPLAMIIESPIVMILSASTTLSKDWASYQKIRRFMLTASAILTVLHALVVFTPLYYLVVVKILGVPAEIIEPARIGLILTIPWTWAVAYRRFNQGVLIRFGHTKAITIGTFIRLSADIIILAIGYLIGTISGVVIASVAIACGLICEAVYVGIVVRPVIRNELKKAPPVAEPVTLRFFLHFYIPLVMTSLLIMLTPLIVSATLSHMPMSLESLAVWPVIIGLIGMFRNLGIAYNEVVVALLDRPQSWRNLRRFTGLLAVSTTVLLLLIALSPFSKIWFMRITALDPDLARMALLSLWIAIPLPALGALQSWFQGAILYSRRTRAITESVLIYLLTFALLAFGGVIWGKSTGLYIGLTTLLVSTLAQTAWLWLRSRHVLQEVRLRDEESGL